MEIALEFGDLMCEKLFLGFKLSFDEVGFLFVLFGGFLGFSLCEIEVELKFVFFVFEGFLVFVELVDGHILIRGMSTRLRISLWDFSSFSARVASSSSILLMEVSRSFFCS